MNLIRLIRIQRLVISLLQEAVETDTCKGSKWYNPEGGQHLSKCTNTLLTDPAIPLLERYPTDRLHIYELTCVQGYSPQAVTARLENIQLCIHQRGLISINYGTGHTMVYPASVNKCFLYINVERC